MIRLQDKTPEVYCAESRDFQLFCRLYDCVLNGVKFDIDTIPDILDAMKCRSSMLALLQTKLGFFTNKKLTDEALRYVLTAFPIMVKNKGSLKSIKQAVNVFFKVYGIRSEVQVWLVSEQTTMFDTIINDHTIVIGINSTVQDVSLLEEIFRYILPTGFGYYFYFYNKIEQMDAYKDLDSATLLFVSDNINSNVRDTSNIIDENDEVLNRLLSAVDTIDIASNDSKIATLNGTYNAGDDSKFLGVYDSFEDIKIPVKDNDCVIVNYEQYIYLNDHWQKLLFRGCIQNFDLLSNAQPYDIVCIPTIKAYYNYVNNDFNRLTYRGMYDTLEDVLSPVVNDLVTLKNGVKYVKTDISWLEYPYTEEINAFPKTPMNDVIYYFDSYNYYLFTSDKTWELTNIPIYLLKMNEIEG